MDKSDSHSPANSIDNDVILSFASIYKSSLRQRDHQTKVAGHVNSTDQSQSLSDEYTQKLFQLAKFYTENSPESPQTVTAINSFFIWRVGQVLLLRPVQYRIHGFRQLIDKQFEGSATPLIHKLVFLEPKEFNFYLRDLPHSDPTIAELLLSIERALLILPSASHVPSNRLNRIEDLRDFSDTFTIRKGQFESLNERVTSILADNSGHLPSDDRSTLVQLNVILSILSGNQHDIIEHFRHHILLLLGAYLSFVDPFLKRSEFSEFVLNWRGKNKPDWLPTFNDELIVTSFQHSESPHDFLNAVGPQLPPWFSFHFGDVLLVDDKQLARQLINFKDRHLPYPEFLTLKYLEFLSERRVSFATFSAYFDRFYRLDDQAPFDLLIPYSVNNHADLELLSAIRANGVTWIVQIIADKLLERPNESGNDGIDDHIRLLFYTDCPQTAVNLQSVIFRALVSRGKDANWTQSVSNLCESLKQREVSSHLQFEEVVLVFSTNSRSLANSSPSECLVTCSNALPSLPKNSYHFIMAIIFIFSRDLSNFNPIHFDKCVQDLRFTVLLKYTSASSSILYSATSTFPINETELTNKLIG